MSFTNFVIATYSRVDTKYWRGESFNIGFYGVKIKLKNLEISGIGKGEQISYVPPDQIVGFGNIKLILSKELLAGKKEIFYRDVSVGNTAGGE